MSGRFAPSPTSDLHLGNLRTALLAWLYARSTGRDFLIRIEDLDQARVAAAAGVAERQLADLAALGIDHQAFLGESLAEIAGEKAGIARAGVPIATLAYPEPAEPAVAAGIADRGGIRIREIPVRVVEKRPPSINLFKRVPNVLKSVAKLTYAIRIRG